MVIAQEIFGVNRHIRAVADGFAAKGYVTIAPCLFDRIRRGIELGYSEAEVQQGRGYRLQIPKEKTLLDLTASINVVKHAGRVAVVGYCWGGTLAYIAACELPVACAVSYYGGQIKDHLGKSPRRPVMYHFGEKDPHIPRSRRREDPRRRSERRVPPLSGRSRIQLRRARQLRRRRARGSRASARSQFLIAQMERK